MTWRERWYEVIFEADTKAGKAFDVALLIAIFLSVLTVVLETVPAIKEHQGSLLVAAEWTFTVLFTIEYVARLICAPRPLVYARSFFGLVDLISILPSYVLALGFSPTIAVVRAVRLLRVFRVLKLGHMLSEASTLRQALWASRSKIAVFLTFVIISVTLIGTAMYTIEGEESGFTSVPESMYWAVVTMTTVGYGDIAPVTPAGKMLAVLIMMLGYSLIIVPTGIVSTEMAFARRNPRVASQACGACMSEDHDADAKFCKRCGEPISLGGRSS